MSKKDGNVSVPEVKEILEEAAELRELSTEQKYALEHSQKFSRVDSKKSRKLINELMKEIEILNEPLATKLADLMPKEAEDIKIVFAKERANIQKKDIEKILDIVGKYG